MYGYFNLKDKVQKYLAFDYDEIKNIFIIIAILSFIAGFDDGRDTFNAVLWGLNLFTTSIIITVSVLVHVITQRIFALKNGYLPRLELNWYMLIIGLILTMITFGKFWFFLIPGIFTMDISEVHRLGYFRYGLSMKQYGWISVTGCLANIFLAIIFKLLLGLNPGSAILMSGLRINIAMAIINMLPLPPLNGVKLFFGSRLFYFFLTGLVVGIGMFLLLLDNILISLILALILAILSFYFANEYLD